MSVILPALTPPTSETENTDQDARRIQFRHPAYPDFEPALLRLYAVDGDGINYDTAFVACCIVTGNKWADGWFAVREDAQSPGDDDDDDKFTFRRVSRPQDGILRGDIYYFLLGETGPQYKYPVHPSFDHWRFPHDRLPLPWSDLLIPPSESSAPFKQSFAATGRDRSCRISGYRDAVEVAHIVPLAAGKWFNSNGMQRYCCHPEELNPIDDERNLLLLRRDLHYLMDQRRFALIPKVTSADNPPKLAVHILLTGESAELVRLYHSRAPQTITGIPVQLLLARFAWSIFTDTILTFFKGSQEYAVLAFNLESGKHVTKRLSSPYIRSISSLFGPYSRSRSVSPRKRNVDEIAQHALTAHNDIDDISLMVDQLGSRQYLGGYEQEERRGRRRKRSWHDIEISTPDLVGSVPSVATADDNFGDETTTGFDQKVQEHLSQVKLYDGPPRKRQAL